MTDRPSDTPDHDVLLDVGDTLCGDLALLLRKELNGLEPGQVLKVVARDPAAPEDIPGWCEVTGHALLHMEPPYYWIRRRNH